MRLTHHIEDYLNKKLAEGIQQNTANSIRRRLLNFAEFVGDTMPGIEVPVRDLFTAQNINRWLVKRRDSVSLIHMNKCRRDVGGLAEYLAYYGHITQNPMYGTMKVKERKKQEVLEYLDPLQIKLLEEACYAAGLSHPKWPRIAAWRNLLAVRLMAWNGLRIAELCGVEDNLERQAKTMLTMNAIRKIDPGHRQNTGNAPVFLARIIGKTGDREIPLGRPVLEALRSLMDAIPPAMIDPRRPIPLAPCLAFGMWGGHKDPIHDPLWSRNLRELTCEAAKSIGLTEYHPHMLRRSFIMNSLEAKIDPAWICLCTGHQDVQEMMAYVTSWKLSSMVAAVEASTHGIYDEVEEDGGAQVLEVRA